MREPCGRRLRNSRRSRRLASGLVARRATGSRAISPPRMFTHDTSRALDPHLHTHCIVFNATFDAVENRWKALQNYELLRARKFAENAYYHEFARELRSFGYRIRNLPRGDFQIEGVPEELCERFSKRDADRLTRRWRSCWRTTRNLAARISRNCAQSSPRKSERGNRKI